VIDPHIHLVDLASGVYSRFAGRGPGEPFGADYLLEDLLHDAADGPQIIGAVHVEALPDDPLIEARTVSAIAEDAPFPIALVGNADLLSDSFEAMLDDLAQHAIFRGIRQVANIHANPTYALATRDILNEDGFQGSLGKLGRRGFSFDMQILGHQLARGAALAAACPETRIVINHAGLWSDRTPEGWTVWKAGLRKLATCPNVAIKISGLGMRDPAWTAESIRPIVYEVIEAFGPERSMFASNFPVDKQHASYSRLWQAFDDVTSPMTRSERGHLFEATARNVYRI
jgi:predicted TIM-barrel fold metal-dependent hydrolase